MLFLLVYLNTLKLISATELRDGEKWMELAQDCIYFGLRS